MLRCSARSHPNPSGRPRKNSSLNSGERSWSTGCFGNIGKDLAVFEPTHGSAPKYAGQYKVNSIATILAAKMMLDRLGEGALAKRLEHAVAFVIKAGRVRTYDMGGTNTTMEMAEAIAKHLRH